MKTQTTTTDDRAECREIYTRILAERRRARSTKTRIEVREYLIAHGHSPRGRGMWAFRMRLANGQPVSSDRGDGATGWHDGIYWVNGSYTTAKATALREGQRLGAAVVSVGS